MKIPHSDKNEHSDGVISLEACIVVPIFVLMLLFFYGLVVSFTGEQAVKHSLIQSAESLSLDSFALEKYVMKNGEEFINDPDSLKDMIFTIYKLMNDDFNAQYFSAGSKWYAAAEDADENYIRYDEDVKKLKDDEQKGKLHEIVKRRFTGYIAGSAENVEEKADSVLKEIGVQGGLSGLDFSETKIDDGTLIVVVKYKQEFVFNFQGLAAFDRKLSVTVDMWGLK